MCVVCDETGTEARPAIEEYPLAVGMALLESRMGTLPRCPDCNGIAGLDPYDMGVFYPRVCCSCDARRVESLMLDLTGPSRKRRRAAMKEVERLRRRFRKANWNR